MKEEDIAALHTRIREMEDTSNAVLEDLHRRNRTIEELQTKLTDREDGIAFRDGRIQGLEEEVRNLEALNADLQRERDQLKHDFEEAARLSEQRQDLNEQALSSLKLKDQQIGELEGELATVYKDLRRAQNTIAELTEQVEELSVSPLDLTQQQRVRALEKAREVVEETGSAGVLTREASSKASLAGVLSIACFIVSGERDYVTTDGEYLLDATRRAVPAALPWTETPERDGGRSANKHQAWKSGVEDVLGWLTMSLAEGAASVEMADGYMSSRDEMITDIRRQLFLGEESRKTVEQPDLEVLDQVQGEADPEDL